MTESEDCYALQQAILRCGRKRALEVLTVDDPDFVALLDGSPLLSLITSDTILAVALSHAWRCTYQLLQVCKRFTSVVKRPEFWAVALREQIPLRFSLAPKELQAIVNPFFRPPPHVWLAPRCEWWFFLCWLFSKNYDKSYHFTRPQTEDSSACIGLRWESSTFVKLRKFGGTGRLRRSLTFFPTQIIIDDEKFWEYVAFYDDDPGHAVYLEKRLVWCDGKFELGHPQSWRGGVAWDEASGDFTPIEGTGCFI